MYKKPIQRVLFFLLSFLLVCNSVRAQAEASPLESIQIEDCYDWARSNYPLIDQLQLLDRATEYNLDNASKGNLPQIQLNGQATYQSEVTRLPLELPNIDIPTLSKDQYRVYGEVYQPLTNFSRVRSRKAQIEWKGQLQQQQVEVDLYQLKDRINQLYFGLLLIEAKNEQLDLLQTDIDTTLARLDAAIENGTATLMDRQLLEVERIALTQQIQENQSNQIAFVQMLAALTRKPIDMKTRLVIPSGYEPTPSLNRPELTVFQLQRKLLDAEYMQVKDRIIPSLGLFVQGGIGRPALNFLSNDFSPYYIAGLKVNWNLAQLYTNKNDTYNLEIQGELIDRREQTFLLNTQMTQSQQSVDIDRYAQLLESDRTAVQLRSAIRETAEIQLLHGLITTIDYVKILNDENRAKQQQKLHEIQLLQAQYQYKTTSGQ